MIRLGESRRGVSRGTGIRVPGLLYLVVVGVAVGGLSACARGVSPPPPKEAVLNHLGIAPGASADSVSDLAIDVFIDASESIRGFVRDPESRYNSALRWLLTRATTAHFGIKLYSFCEQIKPVAGLGLQEITQPSFYSGRETPLKTLLGQIPERLAEGRVVIVVSDFVQSEPTEDYLSLIDQFHKVAVTHPEIVLLGFRSSFIGTYFIETLPRGRHENLQLTQKVGDGRPFYFLIFAPTRSHLGLLNQYVLDGIDAAEKFSPSEPAFEFAEVQFKGQEQGALDWWDRFCKEDIDRRGRHAPLAYCTYALVNPPPGQGGVLLKLNIIGGTKVLPRDPSKIAVEITHLSFNRAGVFMPISEREMEIALKEIGSGDGFTQMINLPRPPLGDWDIYRLRWTPGSGNLSLPAWALEWSSNSDQDRNSVRSTLNLGVLVEAMVRAVTEKTEFLDQVLLIGGRN